MKQFEITIGQKMKFQGKHGICAKYKNGDCNKCILQDTPLCCTGLVPCEDNNRLDKTSVYFPEVKAQQPPWNYIGEEAVPCPDQNGDNEWCNKESKRTYKPITGFETGKWYVCHLNERPSTWNRNGEMDGLLDGKPHKCIMGNETDASFEDIPLQGGGGWSFYCDMDYFEEVPSPVTSYSERQAEWAKENGVKEAQAKAAAYDRLMSGGKKTLKEWANMFGMVVAIDQNGEVTCFEHIPVMCHDKGEGIWTNSLERFGEEIYLLPPHLIDFNGDWKDSLTLPDEWEEICSNTH